MSRNDFTDSELEDRARANEISIAPIVGIVVVLLGVAAWAAYWLIRWTWTAYF